MIFGLFVQPTPEQSARSAHRPGATGNQGQPLPLKHGRVFRPGVHADTVAFTKALNRGC